MAIWQAVGIHRMTAVRIECAGVHYNVLIRAVSRVDRQSDNITYREMHAFLHVLDALLV